MPLFVTVTPGTTVTSSTTLDASTLNLLGTPSIDVTGTVDGGSLSITPGSVTLPSLSAQAASTLVGNASGSSASPTALTSTDLAFSAGTVNIGTGAVVESKIAARAVTAGKLFAVDGTSGTKLLGRYSASSGDVETLTLGSNITMSGGALNTLRPKIEFTNYTDVVVYTTATVRGSAVEITQLTTSITPQTATSKVLVQFNISCEVPVRTAFILERVVGGVTTELGVPTTPGSRIYGIKVQPWDSDNTFSQSIIPISFVDSPASTAAVTYRVKVYSNGAYTFALNRSIDDVNTTNGTRATSQVILQEILPI